MSHTLGLHPHLLSTAPSFLPPVSGTVDIVTDFMSRHSGGKGCSALNLGCDGYKISCDYVADSDVDDFMTMGLWDRQLHYVHAPKLHAHAVDGDDMGTDGWMDFMEESYDGMSKFNGFMHNKFVLFTADIEAKAMELQKDNHHVSGRGGRGGEGREMKGRGEREGVY